MKPGQSGFTYMTVLFVIAFMGLGLAMTGEVWHTAAMRDKEKQLLYAGNQYRRAIERYYVSGPQQYPRAIDDLLRDPRKPGTERYLRKPYFDPITGKSEWGVVKAPDGGIMGVYSTSEGTPWKTSGFTYANRDFEGTIKYSDWKFIYNAAAQQVPLQPQQQPGAPLPQVPLQPLQQPGATSSQTQPQPGTPPQQTPLQPMQQPPSTNSP